jgi:SHAQKYF class myb-like DNA-binding protein
MFNANTFVEGGESTARPTGPSGEHMGKWTSEEVDNFHKGLAAHGKDWPAIQELIPTRTLVQIRTHAQKYFKKLARQAARPGASLPALPKQPNRTGSWTDEEQREFDRGLEMFGRNFSAISKLIPTRTTVQVRTHAQKYLRDAEVPYGVKRRKTADEGADSLPTGPVPFADSGAFAFSPAPAPPGDPKPTAAGATGASCKTCWPGSCLPKASAWASSPAAWPTVRCSRRLPSPRSRCPQRRV